MSESYPTDDDIMFAEASASPLAKYVIKGLVKQRNELQSDIAKLQKQLKMSDNRRKASHI